MFLDATRLDSTTKRKIDLRSLKSHLFDIRGLGRVVVIDVNMSQIYYPHASTISEYHHIHVLLGLWPTKLHSFTQYNSHVHTRHSDTTSRCRLTVSGNQCQ